MAINEKPEILYARTTDLATRRRLQAAVVVAYRSHVESLARKLLRPQHIEEATQAGCIGLLLALEKYDDQIAGPDRGKKSFWAFVFPYVRDEIRTWADAGVYWRKSPNRGRSTERVAARAEAETMRQVKSLDYVMADGIAVVDTFPDDAPTPEDIAEVSEARARLAQFSDTLSTRDREILFSENSQRVRSRHHLSLVERATAFVAGESVSGHCVALRGNTDSVRP